MKRSRFLPCVAALLLVTVTCERPRGAGLATDEVGADPSAEHRAEDPDLQLLRQLRDHLAGLTLISHAAVERIADPAVRQEARLIDIRHDVERDRVSRILETEFGDTTAPAVLPSHQAAADSLGALEGAEYDHAFFAWVIEHHRDAVRTIDRYSPVARRSSVRALANQIRASRLREIAELEARGREGAI